MRDANVDGQLISYGNTVHSFTNWDLDSDHSKPAAYSAKSDARSWAAMRTFFEEIFADRNPRLFGSNLLFPFSNAAILILSVHFPLRPPQFSCLKPCLGRSPPLPAEPL